MLCCYLSVIVHNQYDFDRAVLNNKLEFFVLVLIYILELILKKYDMVKKLLTVLFAFLLSSALSANNRIDIRAWQLHHLDMEYCKSLIDKASLYDINTIVLSHGIISETMQLYGTSYETPGDFTRGKKITELANYAKTKNLDTWIWVHELADVSEKYLKQGKVQLDSKGFWKWLENKYVKVLKDFPELDGIMITFHETQYKIFDDNEVESKIPKPERFQKMINTIYKACQQFNKDLIIRTFVYEPEQLQWLKEGLEKTNDNVIVQSKCAPHDWQPFYPHNPMIGAFPGKRQIIEFDCSSEYTGRNHIPYTSPEYFSYRWKYGMTVPEVVGYNARIDHGGYDALYTVNEINIYTLYRVTKKPDISPDQIWQEWATNKYGNQVADDVINILNPSFEIVNKLFFPQGVWFTNHTKLPHYQYAYKHIDFINKWYDNEYLEITNQLKNPDLQTYSDLIAEKDTALILIQKSLWHLFQAKDQLSVNDYNELQEQFLLLMQTGLVWKNHTKAFFGIKLTDQYSEMTQVVKNAINNIKNLALIIPESQLNKPVSYRENIIQVADELEKMLSN
jgi:hypothetical protein